MDYAALAQAVEPLVERMRRTKTVRLTGPGTDLRFSIEGIPVIPCVGHRNIPDGECFTAPVRDSVEGTISFNTVTVYRGQVFEGIQFTFKGGKIVEAVASNSEAVNTILDTERDRRTGRLQMLVEHRASLNSGTRADVARTLELVAERATRYAQQLREE